MLQRFFRKSHSPLSTMVDLLRESASTTSTTAPPCAEHGPYPLVELGLSDRREHPARHESGPVEKQEGIRAVRMIYTDVPI